jgi:sugar lactone lactonase YvrE
LFRRHKPDFILCLMLWTAAGLAQAYSPGSIFSVAGNGSMGYAGDGGPAGSAELSNPNGAALDSSGNLYIADWGNNRIRKVDASTGLISTVAGNGVGSYAGDGGPATSAELYNPGGVAVDPAGNLFIADFQNNRIREVIVATGNITTVAGTGSPGFSGDGAAANLAQLRNPVFLALDAAGDLFITDWGNSRIREVVAATGNIQTIAGNGTGGFAGDGFAATSGELYYPNGVAVDLTGNVYIGDAGNNRVRRVDAVTQKLSTIAGNGGAGFSGDGAAAISAQLNAPLGVAVDLSGNVLVADYYNNRIRRIAASTGTITTVAGSSNYGYDGDGGPATQAELWGPSDVKLDASGNIFIVDYFNQLIRMVYESGSLWHLVAPGTNIRNPQTIVPSGDITAYPQPAKANICFLGDMPSSGLLLIEVYNTAQQHVATFREDVSGSGYHSYCEDLGPIVAGAYNYHASLGGYEFPWRKFWVLR